MKKFKFNLQRLLDLREAKEKEIQNELAVLLNIQNQERLRQEEYKKKIDAEHQKFNQRLKAGRFLYTEAMMFERFIDFAHRVIATSQDKIDSMEPEIQKVRERLIEASKEKKVVERLKERRLREYLYEFNKEMAKENDDLNQKIFLRNRILNT